MSRLSTNILSFPPQSRSCTSLGRARKKEILKHIKTIKTGQALTLENIRIFGNEFILKYPAIHSLDILKYLRRLFLIELINRYKIPLDTEGDLEELVYLLGEYLNALPPEKRSKQAKDWDICLWAINDACVILGKRRLTPEDASHNHRIAMKQRKEMTRRPRFQ